MTTRKTKRAGKNARSGFDLKNKEPLSELIRRVASRISIDDLDLSEAAAQSLKNANIISLSQLTRCSESDLIERGTDERYLAEIRAKLAELGFPFGGESPACQISVDELRLKCSAELKKSGICTLGDLTQKSEAELLEITQVGGYSIAKIKKRLAKYGLSLKYGEKKLTPQTEISELNLAKEEIIRLRKAGFPTIEDIAESAQSGFPTRSERLLFGGLRKDQKEVIADALVQLGIEFKPEESPHISLDSDPLEIGLIIYSSKYPIRTLRDLTEMTALDVVLCLGHTKVTEVRQALERVGLSLRKD